MIKIGLIGLGGIGQRHLQLLAAEPECELTAVADPAVNQAPTGVAHYASHLQMLDNERLDGVIVAAPTQLHAPIGLDCVSRRLPVLMEKPFTDTVASGRELVDAARAAGVAIAVGHHRRFDPAVRAAREILRSGEIGELVGISGLWAARKPDAYYEVEWRRKPGGGPVLINMIHDVDMLRYWCGEVESAYAETSSRGRNPEVEDSGAIILRFANGVLATISFSDQTPSPWGWERGSADNPSVPGTRENCFRFFGTKGSFEFPNIAVWKNNPNVEPSWLEPISSEARPLPPRAALAAQLKSFCKVVRGESRPFVGPSDGLATLAATVAIHNSAKSGKTERPSYGHHATSLPG